MALPLFDTPVDSVMTSGVDWIEVNGLIYLALKPGVVVSTEERQRIVAIRNYMEGKIPHQRRYDQDVTISLNLESIDGG